MAVGQLQIYQLTHPRRGQAPSHIFYRVRLEKAGRLLGRRAFDFDLRSPRQPRWPEFDRDVGGKPAGMPV